MEVRVGIGYAPLFRWNSALSTNYKKIYLRKDSASRMQVGYEMVPTLDTDPLFYHLYIQNLLWVPITLKMIEHKLQTMLIATGS